MPICLVQTLSGTVCQLTEALSVVVPDSSRESACGVCEEAFPRVREGRAAFHHELCEVREGECCSLLSDMCRSWRERGLFSFFEVRLSAALGQREEELLEQLARYSDWLVVDGTSLIPAERNVLPFERWVGLVGHLRRYTRKVGIRLVDDETVPLSEQALWYTRLALEVGEPGFVFIDGESVGRVVEITRRVLDGVNRHRLRKGSARVVPVVRSRSVVLEGCRYESFDFFSLQELALQSSREFFGGIGVQCTEQTPFLGYSLWQVLLRMVVERESLASVFSDLPLPTEKAYPCVEGMYRCLATVGTDEGVAAANALENVWRSIMQESVLEMEMVRPMQSLVLSTIDLARNKEKGSVTRMFVESMVRE